MFLKSTLLLVLALVIIVTTPRLDKAIPRRVALLLLPRHRQVDYKTEDKRNRDGL